MSKMYKSHYIFRYNILTVKLQSVIREMRSGKETDMLGSIDKQSGESAESVPKKYRPN